jgi:hypothetical protein
MWTDHQSTGEIGEPFDLVGHGGGTCCLDGRLAYPAVFDVSLILVRNHT